MKKAQLFFSLSPQRMSTINSIPFRSTIFYRNDGTVAPIGTVFTISTNGLLNFSDNLSLNTLSASTLTSFSTITASTIRTAGANIAIGQNVSNPNRFVDIRSDIANSVYFDLHSSDSAVPDFSTRIQSLGGATTGTGALNMTASTIGLMASSGVGIGTTVPQAPLHVYNALGVSLSNTNIVNYTQSAILGFNFGGGTVVGTRDSFRILSQTVNRDNGAGPTFFDYGAQADLIFQRKTNNLYSGGVNDKTYTEVMRIGGATGNVGIGTNAPISTLDVNGTINVSGNIIKTGSGPGFIHIFGTTRLETFVDASYGWLGTQSNHPLAFYTNNSSPKVVLTTSGNLGVGTLTPSYLFQVSNNVGDQRFNATNFYTGYISNQPVVSNRLGWYSEYWDTNIYRGGGTESFGWGVSYNGSVSTVPFLFINTTGTVGIGTTTPSTTTKLDVNGISRAITGFGTNSGSVIGLTTTGTIVHRFRGGAALLSIIGQFSYIYLGFVQWIGNVSSPSVTTIISNGYTATIDGNPDITIKSTSLASNASWNITYLACPGYAGTNLFTPGF